MTGHVYDPTFFDYIDPGAAASARAMSAALIPHLHPETLLDVGCGRGTWAKVWQDAGLGVHGVDGDYVRREELAIAPDDFTAADLTKPLDLGRRFDLVQSLEVAEHLAPSASETFVASLAAHGDRILFSAAVPGQGGEFHINERPLAFWQELFAAHGYAAYDCVRPALRHDRSVEPWYRYNTVLYANANGAETLPDAVKATRTDAPLALGGSLGWRARRAVVRFLPRGAVTRIAQVRARLIARGHSRG